MKKTVIISMLLSITLIGIKCSIKEDKSVKYTKAPATYTKYRGDYSNARKGVNIENKGTVEVTDKSTNIVNNGHITINM